MMRIAYILTRVDEIGGAQIHVRDLATWLKEKGHEPHVISGTGAQLSDYLEQAGIFFHEIPDLQRAIDLSHDKKAFDSIKATLKKIKPDIVSCHSSKAGVLGRLAARHLRIPCVFTAHGWAFTDGIPLHTSILYRVVEMIAARWCDSIVAVSAYDRALALQYKIAPAEKIVTVHNGMPFLPPVNRGGKPDGLVKILMIARFGAQKDHATLLQALSSLVHYEWELNLVGGGDNTHIQELARNLGIEDRITFWGQRFDIPDLMAGSDIYALISKWEGLPRSILEAMRASLPVVATSVAGVPEAVVHDETGFLVPRGDEDAVIAALEKLLKDHDLRIRMGMAGRERFEKMFTFDRMCSQTLALYEQLINKGDLSNRGNEALGNACPLGTGSAL